MRQGTDGRRDCATAYCSRTEVGDITAYSLGSCGMGQTDGRIVVLPNAPVQWGGGHNINGSDLRYDTRCYFNVSSKADVSRLNLPHGNDN